MSYDNAKTTEPASADPGRIGDRHPDPCDWCDRLVWLGDKLLVNGGRFCSLECSTNYADAEACGDISRRTA